MTSPFVSPFSEIPEDDVAAAEYAAAQLAEYSKWEAGELIRHGNAPAYHEGHPIPTSNVVRLGYDRRGQARLQNAFIERNPEDEDVKKFTAFADKHPDHPWCRSYRRHLEDRKAAEEKERDAVPASPFAVVDDGAGSKEETAKPAAAEPEPPPKTAVKTTSKSRSGSDTTDEG